LTQGGWTIEQNKCPDGTVFNPAISTCDWAANVPDNVCDGVTHKSTVPTSPRPTTAEPPPGADTRLVCYFGAWAFYRPGAGQFDIDDIDPFLCTHLCYGFANMNNQTYEVVPYDPWYDLAPWDEGCEGGLCNYDSYRRFNALKTVNPRLKTFISIGGWNSGSEQWSEMALDPAKRKIFVESAVAFTSKYGFDGVDFDWEYPGSLVGSDPIHDKEDFTALVEELSAALHGKDKLLSAAVAADPVKAEIAYDIPKVLAAMDFINIMDYDYHGAWDNFTGHCTPLYGRIEEEVVGSPGYMFNVNDSVHWYLEKGAPPSKLNLGKGCDGNFHIFDKNQFVISFTKFGKTLVKPFSKYFFGLIAKNVKKIVGNQFLWEKIN
jgi:chitinase